MTPQRELRYYANIPKVLFYLLFFVGVVAVGQHMLRAGGNVVTAWLLVIFGGLCALFFLLVLAFAVILRKPALAIDPEGITARHLLTPWKAVFVPWSDVLRIGIRTQYGIHGESRSEFQAKARHPNRYHRSRLQRFSERIVPAFRGTVISAPLNLLFLRIGRKRRVHLLQHIYQTFAPEIILHGVVVDEVERVV